MNTPPSNPPGAAFVFAAEPTGRDYLRLADHLNAAPAALHPALAPRCGDVADILRRIAAAPDAQANRRVYHTLRLFIP